MYSKQERIVNENLTDDEIKKTWDAMLPRHRIPLFEQYKLELTTFLGNLDDFLQRTPQLGEQQKLHIKNIMSRTSTAVQQVDEILNKLVSHRMLCVSLSTRFSQFVYSRKNQMGYTRG
ncbi:hypothetical protein COOONC_14643 [Cooperia oncophora]